MAITYSKKYFLWQGLGKELRVCYQTGTTTSMHVTDGKTLWPSFSLLTLILDTILASLAIWFLNPQQIRSGKLGA